jgi:Ser/Thr protein kinase RdoA (MazF antagonist)
VPRAPDDPLRALAGRLHYASNHLRVRPPAETDAAWQLTRRLVERLAQEARHVDPGASGG